MTVSNITSGEIFTIRIYKTFGGYSWANNYEVRATQDVPFAQTAISDLVNRLVALEQLVHLNLVRLDRAVVSTYQPDSSPYNPENFTSIPINASGGITANTDPMPLEYCLFVRRQVSAGRTGKLLYRGGLQESYVDTQSLRARVIPGSLDGFQTVISAWFATTWLAASNPFEMVMASGVPNPTNVRVVQGLQPVGRVVLKQLGNAYFDRNQS